MEKNLNSLEDLIKKDRKEKEEKFKMENTFYSLEDLMKMNKEERRKKIDQANISKKEFATILLTSNKFRKLPGKQKILQTVGVMSEESFKEFVIGLIDRV